MKTGNRTFRRATVATFSLAILGIAMAADPPEETHDGLVSVPDAKMAAAYVNPNADFSGYHKFLILEPYVAFKKNWERDQRRSVHRVSKSDMEDMKRRTAEVFMEVFTETLEEGGYSIVTEADYDVLIIRPAIIDLDVTAPDTMSAGRSRTYTTQAGAATLYIELYDSVTGQILARAIDRKAARESAFFEISSRAKNLQEARRVMGKWATLLRERFDEIRAQ